MLEPFARAVARVSSRRPLPSTFADPRWTLGYAPYLRLFLFGLFNPVVQSMRGLCGVSELARGCNGHGLRPGRRRQFLGDPACARSGLAPAGVRDVVEKCRPARRRGPSQDLVGPGGRQPLERLAAHGLGRIGVGPWRTPKACACTCASSPRGLPGGRPGHRRQGDWNRRLAGDAPGGSDQCRRPLYGEGSRLFGDRSGRSVL